MFASETWTFQDNTPQCILLFIVSDNDFEGPIPETIRASFFQEGFGTQETIICILDDEPGKIIIANLLHATHE